mgnify:CR=1 FL=1
MDGTAPGARRAPGAVPASPGSGRIDPPPPAGAPPKERS